VSALSLSTFRRRGDLIVSAVGELDAETAWQLNTALHNQEPWLERVILDLRYVIRIDGVGIGAIVTADSQTREDGQELVVVRPPADVERWLWLTHRDEHVRVVDDLAGVIGSQPKVPHESPELPRDDLFETCVARGSPASAATPPAARAAQRVAWMSGCSTSAVRPREGGSSS
jgi:anti-anti-sigma factor